MLLSQWWDALSSAANERDVIKTALKRGHVIADDVINGRDPGDVPVTSPVK